MKDKLRQFVALCVVVAFVVLVALGFSAFSGGGDPVLRSQRSAQAWSGLVFVGLVVAFLLGLGIAGLMLYLVVYLTRMLLEAAALRTRTPSVHVHPGRELGQGQMPYYGYPPSPREFREALPSMQDGDVREL